MGVEAVLRRAFMRAQDYMAEWDEYAKQKSRGVAVLEPRRDLRIETLAGILRGEILVHSHCYRADEILMLMRVAEDFHFRVATLQHGLEAFKVAPEIARHGAGVSTFSDWWAYKYEAFDAIPYNAALLTRAGVVTSLNSDSAELARRLNLESAKAVKYGGLSEDEALALVTINPAKQLRIDAHAGSIEPGKDADLAIFNGHPQSTYSHCVMTLVDGEVQFERPGGLAEASLPPATFGLRGGEPLQKGELPGARLLPDPERHAAPGLRTRHREGLDPDPRRGDRGDWRARLGAGRCLCGGRHLAARLPRPDRLRNLARAHRDRLGRRHQRSERAGRSAARPAGRGRAQPAQRSDPGGARQRRSHGAGGAERRLGRRPERAGRSGRLDARRDVRRGPRRAARDAAEHSGEALRRRGGREREGEDGPRRAAEQAEAAVSRAPGTTSASARKRLSAIARCRRATRSWRRCCPMPRASAR
jgi:hypothetical protein